MISTWTRIKKSYFHDSDGIVHRRRNCSIDDCGHLRQLLKRYHSDGSVYYWEHSVCGRHRTDGSACICSSPTRQQEYHWRSYGIHLATKEYEQLFEFQNGNCAICEVSQSVLPHKLCVDHDHKTGVIRGLICKPCNAMIAWFDKVSSLDLIREYLGTDVFNKYENKIHETPKFTILRSKKL